MQSLARKLTSRKFGLSVAALLTAAINTGDPITAAIVAVVAIAYSLAEAFVDRERLRLELPQ